MEMISITKQISKFNFSSGNKIEYIVIHDTGNFKDTAKNNADYFCGGDRKASAHYFVDINSIVQVVEDTNAAWHVGDGKGAYGITNHNSIGVEMCNSGGYLNDTTIFNTIELVKMLMKKYNISVDKVVRHYDASRKVCPNNMSANNWVKWGEFKMKLTPGTAGKKEYKVNYVLEFQKFYNATTKTKAPLVVDGCYGSKTQTAYETLGKLIKGTY